ncbi:MAG TPA: hypothetical protein PK095_11945 [Myxococcota bacterium]|nr:hypothetical protein [Myxococcota bacterium]
MRALATRTIALVSVLSAAGCIEAERKARVEDSTGLETDTDSRDTDETPDLEVEDGVEPEDLREVEASDLVEVTPDDTNDTVEPEGIVTPLPCLPAGCVEPDQSCPLTVGYCWVDGGCVPNGETNPANTCERCDSGVSPRAWRALQDGQDCDDGVTCTANDYCRSGVCRGESSCTSTFACLTPTCDPVANECVASIDEGRCFIDGQCYSDGQVRVGGCARCNPGADQEAWTPGDGHEPDDDLEQANALAFNDRIVTTGTNTDSAWNGPWTTSTLSPLLDTDAFAYVFNSAQGFTRPVVKIDHGAALPLEVCVYMRCLPELNEDTRPTTTVTCGGSDTKKTFDGWVGCCRTSNTLASEFLPTQAWCERSGTKVMTLAEAGVTIRRSVPPASPDCHGYTLRWGVR